MLFPFELIQVKFSGVLLSWSPLKREKKKQFILTSEMSFVPRLKPCCCCCAEIQGLNLGVGFVLQASPTEFTSSFVFERRS